ncbi:MAG: hypothetical protein ACE5MI_13610 [Acidimicrobiia bacterium]
MDERNLERRLKDLAEHIADPEAPELAARVRALLEEESAGRGFLRRRLGVGLAAAAALIIAVAVGLALAPVREAVADLLGIEGVRISLDDERFPEVGPTDVDLGERTTLAEAQAQVEFPILVPADLGDPDEVRLATLPQGGLVYLVYAADGELSETSEGTEVGALLTQFRARLDSDALLKVASTGTTLDPVVVRGNEGFWISGEPHRIAYLDPDGTVLTDSTRLAANTLLWEEDGVTYRIEASVDLDRALMIARSLGPTA